MFFGHVTPYKPLLFCFFFELLLSTFSQVDFIILKHLFHYETLIFRMHITSYQLKTAPDLQLIILSPMLLRVYKMT